MQRTPLLNLLNDQVSSSNPVSNKSHSTFTQHAFHRDARSAEHSNVDAGRSFLLELPDESLGHIITYVDTPPSLVSLSQVNQRLRNYVADDCTWYRSFAYHYWGIGPEESPPRECEIMLRRSESTWKKEFIKRYDLLLRWEKSRNAAMSYQPHSWSINSMHLLDNSSLMTASLQYGVVARSFPLTGKILRGFLDASGTANGFGIGNPNIEFSPHVSCIAISSLGGTAHIIWGFRNGEIALTTAPRVMDSDRPTARYIRCNARDEHPGQIRSLIFTGNDELILSGCSQGRIKLWESKRLHCLWSGTTNQENDSPPDPCVKIVFLATSGVLAAVCQSGDVVIWSGFQVRDDGSGHQEQVGVVESTRVICSQPHGLKTVDCFFIDPRTDSYKAILLIHYAGEKSFLRHTVNTTRKAVVTFRFGVEGCFPISSLKPCFTSNRRSLLSSNALKSTTLAASLSALNSTPLVGWRPFPFIMTGDSSGGVSLWSWDVVPQHGSPSNGAIHPWRTWEAHEDGSVSCLEANDYIILTGSSRGNVKVWDILTLNLLRVFPLPITRSMSNGEWPCVEQIIARDDLLVANIGARVLVWQAKPIALNKKIKVKQSSKPKGRGIPTAVNKWEQHKEMISDIRETKQEIQAERARVNRFNGRLKAQQGSLDQLGLTETEAVDYLLMVSREEEERRTVADLLLSSTSPTASDATPTNSTSHFHASTQVDALDGIFVLDGVDAPPTSDINEVRLNGTPWSAQSDSSNSPSAASSLDDPSEFPNITSSSVHTQPIRLAGSWSRGSPISSWDSPKAPTVASSVSGNSLRSRLSDISQSRHDEEDEELKYVLELSLAEARSRDEA